MSIRLALFCLVSVLACSLARSAENPLTAAKTGDWVEYTITTVSGTNTFTTTVREKVIKKTDDEAVIEALTKAMGKEHKRSETIKLKEAYDPLKLSAEAQKTVTITEKARGKDEIKAAGKTLKAEWVEREMKLKEVDLPPTVSKTWISPDVPVRGIARLEINSPASKSTMELTGFGRGK